MSNYHYSDDSNRQLLPDSGQARPTHVMYLEPLEAPTSGKGGQKGVLEYWQLIRGRKWAITLCALLGVAAAAGISYHQTPLYLAKTSLEFNVGGEGPKFAGVTVAQSDMGGPINAYLQTQVRVLQSASLRRRVVEKLKEEGVTAKLQPAVSWWRKLPGLRPDSGAAKGVIPAVKTDTKTFGEARVIEILAESSDPKFAAAYANTMAREYIDSSVESKLEIAQRTSLWLDEQLKDMRSKLQRSGDELQAYSRKAGLVFSGEDSNVEHEKLKQLQAEFARAEADRASKQSAYEIASKTSAETVPAVVDNSRLSGYQIRLAELRRELADLSSSLTPEHYKVRRVQAQISELETTLQRERDNIISRIRNDYQAAVVREQLLMKSYVNQLHAVSDSAGKSVYFNILKREVESNRKLYDELLQQMKEVGIGAALQASNVRVIDVAEAPLAPYKPSLPINLALGLASGLIGGCMLVFLSDQVNRSLNAPGEAPFYLKVPELGVIPESEPDLIEKFRGRAFSEHLNLPENGQLKLPPGKGESVELVTWQNRPSLLAESFRSALASILVSKGTKGRPRVILVTSTGRGEGKSTTVSNLGIALAEINQRVLLLDADLRKPQLHRIFNLPNSWGLSDLLRERISLKDSPLEALVRPTEIEGLFVLPSGPGTASIANLLYSNRMVELIERLRGEFDAVLIDTPPMLCLSDARVLGHLAEGAILVIRAGTTSRDAAVLASQRLMDDGIRVLGTILNGWNLKDKSRYGYSAYTAVTYASENE